MSIPVHGPLRLPHCIDLAGSFVYMVQYNPRMGEFSMVVYDLLWSPHGKQLSYATVSQGITAVNGRLASDWLTLVKAIP